MTRDIPDITPLLADLKTIRGGRGLFKEMPSYGKDGITDPWEELSPEVQRGLELAAYIVRMYGDGDVWAEAILSRGEQIRALWWMEHEKRKGL